VLPVALLPLASALALELTDKLLGRMAKLSLEQACMLGVWLASVNRQRTLG